MDRTERLLREELHHSSRLPVPELDAMLDGVARAHRRRKAVTTGTVLAVAGLIAAAALTSTGSNDFQPLDTPSPTVYQNELINVVFTDPAHGYAVQRYCSLDNLGPVPDGDPTPDVHRDCTAHLLATADGGHTWEGRVLPAEPAVKDTGVDLTLGHSLMLWRTGPATIALGGDGMRYWTSANGGRSWTESATPRSAAPDGGFAWFGRDDGIVFLAHPPTVGFPANGPAFRAGSKNPPAAGTDGSVWLACQVSSCVQITRDRGATWQPATPLASAAVDWTSTFDGQTGYAGVFLDGTSRLMRTTDGGATWARLTGLTGLPDRGVDGIVLPNGDLLMTRSGQEGGMYRLRAGASGVEHLASAPAHANAFYVTGGVVVAAPAWDERDTPDVGPVAWISTDSGTTWHEVPVR